MIITRQRFSVVKTESGSAYMVCEIVGVHNGDFLTMTHAGVFESKAAAVEKAAALGARYGYTVALDSETGQTVR